MIAGGVDNRTSGGAIRDPEDMLRDGRVKMGGVDPVVKASNTTFTKSIRGSDIPGISSKSFVGSNRAERSSRDIDPPGISILLKIIEITWR